jgi:hypothetical protein
VKAARFIFALALIVVFAGLASAQFNGCRAGFCNAAPAAATYTGPGDVVSGATAWYGLRAYNAAYATGSNKAINVRRASDNATSDINILSTGALDVATASTFCALTTCFLTKAYDQSGHSFDYSQATAGSQAQLIFNCLGTLPCVQFSGSQKMATGAVTNLTQPFTVSQVAERTGSFTSFGVIFGSSGTAQSEFNGSANSWSEYAGNRFSATASDSAWHAGQYVFNGASSSIKVDATTTSGNASTNSTSTQYCLSGNCGGAFLITANLGELGLWPSGISSGNQTSLCHNQFLYWATSVSC